MKARLSAIQVQKQILAPLMQQSIALLLLPLTELTQTIEQELQTNPLLEIDQETENLKPETKDAEFSRRLERLTSLQSQDDAASTTNNEAEPNEELIAAKELPLEDYLMQQLRLEFSGELERKIGELIIGNIDEDGYLTVTADEIARLAESTDMELIENMLSAIRHFDPPGIASRNLKECLLTQLKIRNTNGALVTSIVNDHLEDLGKKRHVDIAKRFAISLDTVKQIAHVISTLEPKPARNYRPISDNIYIKPDVIITHDPERDYQIRTNEEGIPTLRINTTYKNMLNRPDLKEDERLFIKERLEGAMHFMKSIEQRGQTIREITQFILDKQKDFFAGDQFAIAPMTLKDVATAIDRNESTISRAINNKYIDTPQGLFSMKFFFSQAISSDTTIQASSQGIKEEMKDVIGSENKASPLSDQDIQSYFTKKGLRLARRTVAKYREALRIPPSYLRKE